MERDKEESVYGENVPIGEGKDESGIREKTVAEHPQNDDVDQTVAEDFDQIRDEQAKDAGSGGMGRESTPRNEGDAPQGEFAPIEDSGTPG